MNVVCYTFGTNMIMHSLLLFIFVLENILRIVFILRQFSACVITIEFRRIV
jgi:hypothetical protein